MIERLRALAPVLAARYFGRPVWLVGGALRDDEPRDYDLVVALEYELFDAAYSVPADEPPWPADTPSWRRWARDAAKESEWLTREVRAAVDFKVQAMSCFERQRGDRVRL